MKSQPTANIEPLMLSMKSTLIISAFLLVTTVSLSQTSTTEQKLAEYKSLYDKGLIEEDEYKKLKSELLFGNTSNSSPSTSSGSVDEINIDNVKRSIGEQIQRESRGGYRLLSFEKINTIAQSDVIRELEFLAVVEVAKNCYQQPPNAVESAIGQCFKLYTTDEPKKSPLSLAEPILLKKGTRTTFGGKVTIKLSEKGWVKAGSFTSYGCKSSYSPIQQQGTNLNSEQVVDDGRLPENKKRFSCYSSSLFDYAVVEVETPNKAYDLEQERVFKKVLEKIGRNDNIRLSQTVDLNKEPSYKIKVEYAQVSYTKKTVKYSNYYSCKINISFILFDSEGKEIDRTVGDVETKFDENIQSQGQAFELALKYIYKAIDTPVYHFFPVKAKLTGVYDENRKGIATRGVVDKGSSVGVFDNCRFEIFHNGRKIGLIHIRDLFENESKGTFAKEGIEEINELIEQGEELYCVTWY